MPDCQKLLEELRTVFSGSSAVLNSLLPPLIFLLANTLLAIGQRFLLNTLMAFFLPTPINGALTTLGILASLLVKRPTVAFTSHITRGWTLAFCWHPPVRRWITSSSDF